MLMEMRRLMRLTTASRRRSLHLFDYNFARPHTTLANPTRAPPAMAVGVSDHVWSMTEIASSLG
jgi:hypothetical protein